MSNGVSPVVNVRNSFKVPGEGVYELRTELQPPTVASTSGANTANRSTSGSSQISTSSSANTGGPLGLANATVVSVTGELTPTSEAAATGNARSTSTSAPNTPERTSRNMPLVKKLGFSLSRFGSSGPSDFAPGGKSAKNTSFLDMSAGEIEKQSTREREHHYILVFSGGDVLCTSSSKDDETVQTLKFRSAITRVEASNGVKLLVGCANGEVYYYPDVTTLASKGNATAPSSALSAIGGPSSANVYNKDGNLASSRVTGLQWIPGSTTKFIAVHIDGIILVYDVKHRGVTSKSSRIENAEDWKSTPPSTVLNSSGGTSGTGTSSSAAPGTSLTAVSGIPTAIQTSNGLAQNTAAGGGNGGQTEGLSRAASHNRRAISQPGVLGVHQISVTHPPRGRRANPILQMQVGKGGLNAAAFSPEGPSHPTYLALACRDGYLRVLDFEKEQLVLALRSYYGALLCVSWSHDGKYIATGGEDDLVTVWCPSEASIVARLEGHSSWVSAVAWDTTSYFGGRYRIGSAGQDAKIALWDFTVDALHLRSHHRPSKAKNGPVNAAGSTTQAGTKLLTGKLGRGFRSTVSSGPSVSSESSDSQSTTPIIQKEALGRAEVPILEPLVDHIAHNEPMTDILFTTDAIVTACTGGVLRVWWKPPIVTPMLMPSGSAPSESNSASLDLDLNGGGTLRVELD